MLLMTYNLEKEEQKKSEKRDITLGQMDHGFCRGWLELILEK